MREKRGGQNRLPFSQLLLYPLRVCAGASELGAGSKNAKQNPHEVHDVAACVGEKGLMEARLREEVDVVHCVERVVG
jgi:hypothetical protein